MKNLSHILQGGTNGEPRNASTTQIQKQNSRDAECSRRFARVSAESIRRATSVVTPAGRIEGMALHKCNKGYITALPHKDPTMPPPAQMSPRLRTDGWITHCKHEGTSCPSRHTSFTKTRLLLHGVCHREVKGNALGQMTVVLTYTHCICGTHATILYTRQQN